MVFACAAEAKAISPRKSGAHLRLKKASFDEGEVGVKFGLRMGLLGDAN
jgi:hypothetical protein